MQPWIGQLMAVGFSYAPKGWAICAGQLMSISQNQALFALLGTYYGGDGITTFALPDLRGRSALGFGQGPGLSPYDMGTKVGSESVTLNVSTIPLHSHVFQATATDSSVPSPDGALLGKFGMYGNGGGKPMPAIGPAGGNQPHENRQPFGVVLWCIATVGVFPSRN
ncbi:MAG: tail fiber protein [Bryobacteraceae bacterium]